MTPKGSRMRLEFSVPSRGLFGYKSEFLTDTKGEGIMNAVFDKYDVYRGEINRRPTGSLIAHETGESVTYLYSISSMYGVTQSDIVKLNTGSDEKIFVGRTLRIPRTAANTQTETFHTSGMLQDMLLMPVLCCLH